MISRPDQRGPIAVETRPMMPCCDRCRVEMRVDTGRRPALVAGTGCRPGAVRVPCVCPDCGRRGVVEFPGNDAGT